jgi:DcmR-like sensory protein
MTVTAAPEALGLRQGDHICGFYTGEAARDELTAMWVAEGARAGHKCVCFVEDSPVLRRRFDAEIPEQVEHVEFRNVEDAYLPGGTFCKDTMLARLQESVTEATDAGYPGVRLLGDMSWVIRDGVDTSEVWAYEAEVNALSPQHPAFFICLYDLDRFDGSLVIEVLRTHAKVLLNGLVINNPYYTSGTATSGTASVRP